MKKLIKTKTAIIAFSFLMIGILLISCKKENKIKTDLNNFEQIIGSYTGTLTGNGLKTTITAHANIQLNADSSIRVNCYGGEFDTTFMLDVFDETDSIHVCLTGNDFFNEYGHMRNHQGSSMSGYGNMMSGGIMGGNHNFANDSTGWVFHLGQEHHATYEKHFGGFDLNKHTFGYNFRNPHHANMFITFQGTKNQ